MANTTTAPVDQVKETLKNATAQLLNDVRALKVYDSKSIGIFGEQTIHHYTGFWPSSNPNTYRVHFSLKPFWSKIIRIYLGDNLANIADIPGGLHENNSDRYPYAHLDQHWFGIMIFQNIEFRFQFFDPGSPVFPSNELD